MNIVDGVLVGVTSPSENLVLPKVFEIGEGALQGSSIKSVVIPEGVRVIRGIIRENKSLSAETILHGT